MKLSDCPLPPPPSVACDLFRRQQVSIGIPDVLLRDALMRATDRRTADLAYLSLMREFSRARGYSDTWGHVIRQQVGEYTVLRIVPVAVWETTADPRTRSAWAIPDLTRIASAQVIAMVREALPPTIMVAGAAAAVRLHPHSLVTLLLREPNTAGDFFAWCAREWLPERLPRLLAAVHAAILSTGAETEAVANCRQGDRHAL
jgi:hypothetical protein